LDQNGRQVHFFSDLVKNKVVAIDFIFTSCEAICPRMGATFDKLQQLMADRIGRDFFLISISIDPLTDTPERLKAWSKQFNAGPGWTLLTGAKPDVEALLKALGAFTPNKDYHSAIVLLGNGASGAWVRTYGLTAPSKLVDLITALGGAAGPGSGPSISHQPSEEQATPEQRPLAQFSAAHRSFPDVALVNQDGQKMQLYSDLLKDKVVVISPFFTTPQGLHLTTTVRNIQEWLGDRLGKEVYLISISVNPEADTPAQLKSFAEQFKAKAGWYFLTGDKDSINLALSRLGQYGEKKEDNLESLIIGNDHTGLWIKVFGPTKAEQLVNLVEIVLNDRGSLTYKIRF
jgi:cytochrome oxidase Cu insertion factor (SCO1/SenC/PrrC family)